MEQMENYVTATGSNSKRIFDEDSVSKVTSDGEPLLTMVAGLSGLLTGIIILAVLVSMVACRNHKINAGKVEQLELQHQHHQLQSLI